MNKYTRAFVLIFTVLTYAVPISIIQADTLVPNLQGISNASSLATTAMVKDNSSPMFPTNLRTVWITAYASVPEETDDDPFITASGHYVRDGVIASNFLPFGTKVRIPALFGSKIFTVEDRMNKKFDTRVDIWMPTVIAALNFGIRRAQIVVLTSPDLALK